MKFLFCFLLGLILLGELSAQTYTPTQRRQDSLRLDSLCQRQPNNCMLFGDMIGSNSVFRNHVPKIITANATICFDKKFHYYANVNGNEVRGCYYVNTTDGYVAQYLSHIDESCNGMDNPQPGFDMMIVSKVGESFLYRIDQRGNRTFTAQMPLDGVVFGGQTTFVLNNPDAIDQDYRELFTDQNLPTLPYRIEGSSSSSLRYLFGLYQGNRIRLQGYLGAFGTGYYKDESGNTFLCLASEAPDNYIRIDRIEDVAECFDGSSFSDEMEEIREANNQIIADKEEDIAYRSQSGNVDDCEARDLLLEHEKRMLDKEKRANELLNNGANLNTVESQRIISDSGDPMNLVIKDILELQIRICGLENSNYRIQNEPGFGGSIQNNNVEIGCLNTAITNLRNLEGQMNVIGNQNQNSPGVALGKKSTLYFQTMSTINANCNVDRHGNLK